MFCICTRYINTVYSIKIHALGVLEFKTELKKLLHEKHGTPLEDADRIVPNGERRYCRDNGAVEAVRSRGFRVEWVSEVGKTGWKNVTDWEQMGKL